VLGALQKFDVPNAPPVSVAMLERSGRIVAVNEAWKDLGRQHGLQIPNFGVGANYLDYCGHKSKDSQHLAGDLRDLLAGKTSLVTRIYPCNSPSERRWFFLIGLPLSGGERSAVALMHVNLTPFLPRVSTIDRQSGTCEAMIDFDAVAGSVESATMEALSSQVMRMLGPRHSHPKLRSDEDVQQNLELAGLSKRQLEILGLLAEGKTNTEIARILSRSPNTIKLHVSAILRQLNLKSRTQAALLASKHLKSEFQQRRSGVSTPARARQSR
jgi:DNA-binding CsgD family transcriptional regulator